MARLKLAAALVVAVALALSLVLHVAEWDAHPLAPHARSIRESLLSAAGRSGKWLLSAIARGRLSPINGTLSVPGLQQPVEIVRDEWGYPHIYAKSTDDALVAQGFVHAQDRLFQLDLTRRAARGKLSELVGELALEPDMFLRAFGFGAVAEKDQHNLDAESRHVLQRYTDGINAFINSTWFQLPIEYTLLGTSQVEEWTIVDTLAICRIMMWQMSKGWAFELTTYLLIDAVGEEAARELFPHYGAELPLHLPKGIEEVHLTYKGPSKASKEGGEAVEDLPILHEAGGSNAWAVSGAKSRSGHALLSNDPHLALRTPGVWYGVHMVAEQDGLDVIGASMPGLPGVLTGRNQHVSWGVTLANIDVDDLFIEKFSDSHTYEYKGQNRSAKVRLETIHVKGRDQPHVEVVVETVHGPIISQYLGINGQGSATKEKLAVRSSSLVVDTPPVHSLLRLNFARNWTDFTGAIKGITQPALNLVYADTQGNIGYYVTSRAPIRKKGDGTLPVPGWTGEYDWEGWVAFEDMPHALNPERGYIMSANHKIIGEDYPHFMGHSWTNGIRAARLDQLLTSQDKFDLADFAKFQTDVHALKGREIVEEVLRTRLEPKQDSAEGRDVLLALRLLREWDFNLDRDSVGAALYEVFKYTANRNLLEPTLGTDLALLALGDGFHAFLKPATEYITFDSSLLYRAVRNDSSLLLRNVAGGKAGLFERSLAESVAWLRTRFGSDDPGQWQWGKLHTGKFAHFFAKKPILDKIFSVGPYALPGDNDTPYMTLMLPRKLYEAEGFVPSWRQVFDMGQLDQSYAVHGPGQSGQLGSPHYDDLAAKHFEGDLHPLLLLGSQELKARTRVTGTIDLRPRS